MLRVLSLSQTDRMQAWHRQRFRKRSKTVSDQAAESYLREDVPCGHPGCTVCESAGLQLPAAVDHLLVPDARALDNYLEVFQLPEMYGIVYTTSAMQQVRQHVSRTI